MRDGYVLVKMAPGWTAEDAEVVANIPEVRKIEFVEGPFDVILHVSSVARTAEPELLERIRSHAEVWRALPCWLRQASTGG